MPGIAVVTPDEAPAEAGVAWKRKTQFQLSGKPLDDTQI